MSGFAVGYLAPGTLRLPVPTYYPVLHELHLTSAPPGISMRYYGDFCFACAAGLACAIASLKLRVPRASIPVATATALSLLALDLAWYLSRLLASV